VALTGDAPATSRWGRAWGGLGVAGVVAFTSGWAIAETWQGPRYSLVNDTISDMQAASAPHMWFPVACFAFGGVATFCFTVFGLRPALTPAGKLNAHAPWMLAVSALALGNSFPLVPCSTAQAGCTLQRQLDSPGGLTDAIVAGIALSVLAFTPQPLWERLKVVPSWRRLGKVMAPMRVVCPLLFIALAVSSATGLAQGLAERALVSACIVWVGALALALAISNPAGQVSRGSPRG